MRLLLLVVLAPLLGGCAGTRTFHPADRAFAARHLDGRAARVVLADGRGYDARALRVTPDSVTWTDPSAPRIYGVPVLEVARLDERSPRLTVGRTARNAALAGALLGVAMGMGAGYDSGGCVFFCTGTPTASERRRGALVFGLYVGAQAAASGAMYGAFGGALAPATWTFVPDVPPAASAADPLGAVHAPGPPVVPPAPRLAP